MDCIGVGAPGPLPSIISSPLKNSPLPLGEGQGEGRSQHSLASCPHPNPPPEGEGASVNVFQRAARPLFYRERFQARRRDLRAFGKHARNNFQIEVVRFRGAGAPAHSTPLTLVKTPNAASPQPNATDLNRRPQREQRTQVADKIPGISSA